MNIHRYLKLCAASCFFILLTVMQGHAESIDSLKILKIATEEQMASVKGADGKLRLLRVGDTVGEKIKVIEIAKNRVVMEDMTDKGPERVILRLEGGKQRVERIRKAADKQPVLMTPRNINKD